MENLKDKQQQVEGFINLTEKAEVAVGNGAKQGYKKIEEGVVESYKKIESTVVDGFNNVNDKIIEKVFSKDGENLEETKARLSGENKNNK